MKAQCPKCKSIYDIEDAKIPAGGRYGKCSQCGVRFFISKARTRAKNKKAGAGPVPGIIHAAPEDLKTTKYEKLRSHISNYYRSKNSEERYQIAVFLFTYRELPSREYVKSEALRLRTEIKRNQKQIATGDGDDDSPEIDALKIENQRHQNLLKVMKDLVDIRSHFAQKGIRVELNEILTVLSDVERQMDRGFMKR